MLNRSLIDPEEFVGLEGVAHLCSGGEAPFLRRHLDACARFAGDKGGGMSGRDRLFAVYARAKERLAARLGIAADAVALLAHASEGLNQVAHAIDWREGDNVVVADVEFPSGIYPFAALHPRGVELRLVPSRDYYVALPNLESAVDARTRLVVASQVSYLSGQRLDIGRLAALAHRIGALLAVDATHGVGVFADRPERMGALRPATLGWHSVREHGGPGEPAAMNLREDASRLEAGNPSFLPIYVLESALERLDEIDPAASLDHALRLGDEVIGGLRRRGHPVITPVAREERAGNVCFLSASAPDLVARLAARGVHVWGSEGRVRVSLHAYNDSEDVARLFDALDGL